MPRLATVGWVILLCAGIVYSQARPCDSNSRDRWLIEQAFELATRTVWEEYSNPDYLAAANWHLILGLENKTCMILYPEQPAIADLVEDTDAGPTKLTFVQFIVGPVSARRPGNEWVKPCSPANHDSMCYDPTIPDDEYHIYHWQENCEKRENARCVLLGDVYVPVDKPVVVSRISK